MKIWCKKNGYSLVPIYPKDREKFSKIDKNRVIEVSIKQPRNIKHHRKFYAILGMAFSNWPTDYFKNEDQLLDAIKIEAGFTDVTYTMKGVAMIKPKSLRFEECDQLAFKEFYDNAMIVIMKYLDISLKEINKNYEDFM